MSTAAKSKGIKAVVVDGGCRDIVEHLETGFPVSSSHQRTGAQLISRQGLCPSSHHPECQAVNEALGSRSALDGPPEPCRI
jgi:hypothetical protein